MCSDKKTNNEVSGRQTNTHHQNSSPVVPSYSPPPHSTPLQTHHHHQERHNHIVSHIRAKVHQTRSKSAALAAHHAHAHTPGHPHVYTHPFLHACSISSRSELLRHLEAVSCAAAEMALAEAPASIATKAVFAAWVILSSCLPFSTTF